MQPALRPLPPVDLNGFPPPQPVCPVKSLPAPRAIKTPVWYFHHTPKC